MAEWLKALAC